MLDASDYKIIKEHFTEELKRAANQQSSSIPFIKNQLPNSHLLPSGLAQGIVIGGTNYIVKTIQIKDNEQIKVFEEKSGVLPIFNSVEILINFLVEHINPNAQAIGINFGFPVKPVIGTDGELDSQLLSGTKEHSFEGVTMPIGQITKTLFAQKYHKKIKVSVANDTVCLTLSEKNNNGSLIVGTGFNMALRYKEQQTSYVVNLEAGNFNKFPQSKTLHYLDQHSEMPGQQLFEKSISGKYLFEHFNAKMAQIDANQELISSTRELSAIAQIHTNKPIQRFANTIIEQAAKQVAAAIAGMYIFSGSPKTFILIGEGSLLWKGFQFNETLHKQLQAFGIPKGTIVIKDVSDSSIRGAFGLLR